MVFERSPGILAITIIFLAERLQCCTNSELYIKFELQQRAPALFFPMPISVVQNTLVMDTCACTPVGPP
eukprot:417500-Heterocapsa_arctica.AAC.1